MLDETGPLSDLHIRVGLGDIGGDPSSAVCSNVTGDCNKLGPQALLWLPTDV